MKRFSLLFFILFAFCLNGAIIIDHTCRDIDDIPLNWIDSAKTKLNIGYQHTSHGNQLVAGMDSLDAFMGGNGIYIYNDDNSDSVLTIDLQFSYNAGGAEDLGRWGTSPHYTAWLWSTRRYLGWNCGSGDGSQLEHYAAGTPDYNGIANVIMWSWCGQVSGAPLDTILNCYLAKMNQLEIDYPEVQFVYMTGHLDRDDPWSRLRENNDTIRAFCTRNDKILYDFADIEAYDPDGRCYRELHPTDGCCFDANGDGETEYFDSLLAPTQDREFPLLPDSNWALAWQGSHVEGADWYNCCPMHTWPLNANLKAYAAWHLYARLAGWDGVSGVDVNGNFEGGIRFYIDRSVVLGEANLNFYLPRSSLVRIKLVDILGRTVSTVLERNFSKGNHSYAWQAIGIKSGIYLLLLTHPSGQISEKIIILGD